MTEYLPYIPTGGLLIVCVCLLKMMNGKLHGKVSRGECHDAQEAIKDKIDTLDEHLTERFNDMKDFIRDKK